jgi:hypothetical protein
MKRAAKELKRVGWDKRSWKARLGMGAVIATLMTVGNAGAGIAALGTAIGVPLWIVIGAGAIVDEVASKLGMPKTIYTDINAKKEIDKKS